MKALLTALVSGLLFGGGLVISDMVNPERVLGFLDVTGAWDPALLVVMAAALLPSVIAYQIKAKLRSPLCETSFQVPTRRHLDGRLLIGAALFGIGWGLVGLCPGPALAALTTGDWQVVVFVLSMLSGVAAYRWTSDR